MELNRKMLEDMLAACKAEQEQLRIKALRQDGAIAVCEMLLKKLEEEKNEHS